MGLEKTWDEHVTFLSEMIKLKLFYLWNYCKEHPEKEFKNCIREKVDIYQLTSFNKNSITANIRDFDSAKGWREKELEIERAYLAYQEDCPAFEEMGYTLLEESIQNRPQSDLTDLNFLKGFQFGSIKYDATINPKDYILFFMDNALYPYSPFQKKDYLKNCLLDLIEYCEEKHNSKFLEMTSWLNSYDKWLELFPSSWTENRGEELTDINWTNDFWGQFITSRKTFNTETGTYFRKNKKLKYPLRYSYCSIKELKKHLYNLD